MNFVEYNFFNLLGPGRDFRGAGRVLVRSGSLPASLLERELNGNGLSVLCDDMGASLNSSILVEGSRFVHLGIPEGVRVMKLSARVLTGLRARLRSSVNSGAERVLTRSSLLERLASSAVMAILSGSSGELTLAARSSGRRSHHNQFKFI